MRLPSLPNISKTTLKTVHNLFTGNSQITYFNSAKVSPHVTKFAGIIIDKASKKSDYTKDLQILKKYGVPVKKMAELLGISVSYVYKLLKKGK